MFMDKMVNKEVDEDVKEEMHQQEASDTKAVTGSYTVNLPDGRVQTVTYTSDPYGYGGHVADVVYSGTAHYPEHKPAYHPAPAYKPAPKYHA